MPENKTQRLTIRFTDEDVEWLEHQAADEGVETATLVRMVIHRLRNGRPPLVGQMLEERVIVPPEMDPRRMRTGHAFAEPLHRPIASHVPPVPADEEYDPGEAVTSDVADTILESRLAEFGQAPAQANNGHAPALSLRHVPREKYNPGRQ